MEDASVSELEMPQNLVRALEHDDGRSARRAWMADLPVVVDDLARRWSLDLDRPFELFRSLPGTSERSVLLCTDLHPGNALAARREPWLVIDPKP
jgi:hypothetical protein